jgi:hypothetical protein
MKNGRQMSLIREQFEAWSERIRSPILGSFLLSFFAFNWPAIWVLLFSEAPVIERIEFFERETNLFSLLLWPSVSALLIALSYPWLRLFGAWVAAVPTGKLRRLQHGEGQNYEIFRLNDATKLIEARARYNAVEEQAKIDAAKRLKEAGEVGGSALQAEIKDERLSRPTPEAVIPQLTRRALGLLKDMGDSKSGLFTRVGDETLDGTRTYRVGDNHLAVNDNREAAELEDAMERLREHGLVGGEGRITQRGYEVLEQLSKTSKGKIARQLVKKSD